MCVYTLSLLARFVFFLLVLTVQGVGASSLGPYLLMYMRQLGGSYSLCGLAVVFQVSRLQVQ
jgi:hypothetical protein